MNKIIYLIFFVFFLIQSSINAEVIQIGIKYNEASARIEAFKDIEKRLDKDFIKNYLKDPNKKENIDSIRNNIFILSSRVLCPFYLKSVLASYAITYNETDGYVFYYNILGDLIKVDVINGEEYPKKIYGYSRRGKLISVGFEVDENEHFIYDEKGKLIAHWQDNIAYDENNDLPKFLQLKRGGK